MDNPTKLVPVPPHFGQRRRGRYGTTLLVRGEGFYAVSPGGARLGPYSAERVMAIWPDSAPAVPGSAAAATPRPTRFTFELAPGPDVHVSERVTEAEGDGLPTASWVITYDGKAWSKMAGAFVYEPSPSHRDDAFLSATTWHHLASAFSEVREVVLPKLLAKGTALLHRVAPLDDPPLSAVALWLAVREKHGHEMPRGAEELRTAAEHSALLHWIASGHAPLPEPPPLSHGYPAHAWVAEGRGVPWEVWEMEETHPLFSRDRPAVLIDQHPWLLVERRGAEEWLVRPYQGRSFQLGSGVWRVWSTGGASPAEARKAWRLERLAAEA